MTKARSHQICVSATPYYHCISRCVRKAYLCGENETRTKNFDHRRAWIEKRLLKLSQIFTIKIVSYAVMHNHYHVILSIDKKKCQNLSIREIVSRWHCLFNGTSLSQELLRGNTIPASLKYSLNKTIETWRERLMSISWFMRCMNEKIARWANQEDNCTGRFWEGRFKSQALMDEKSLLACMAYVDLNPIRAGLTKQLETSEHTSIKRRLALQKAQKLFMPCAQLLPFKDEIQIATKERTLESIPLHFNDYVTLLKGSSQVLQEQATKDFLLPHIPLILQQLGIKPSNWMHLIQSFESTTKTIVGTIDNLTHIYTQFSIKRFAGKAACIRYFSN